LLLRYWSSLLLLGFSFAVSDWSFGSGLFGLWSFSSSRLNGSGSIVLGSGFRSWETFLLLLLVGWASERLDLVEEVFRSSASVLLKFWLRLLGGRSRRFLSLGLLGG
jgi:hypothetical protein